jgi:hypothetical protein
MNPKEITLTTKEYSRTDSGKSWRSKPDTIETETVTMDQVKKMTADDTLRFFRRLGGYERLERSYTAYGFLPWLLTSISPCREIKKVREYSYS